METQKMTELYQRAAVLVNDMIPEEWEQVYIYAQIQDESGEVFFYYYPIGKKTPVYIFDIENEFVVNKNEFLMLNYDLYECFHELREEFRTTKQPLWTNVTFILKNTGSFKLEYGYEDLSEVSKMESQIIWEYKYLGKKPNGSLEQGILQKYLDNK